MRKPVYKIIASLIGIAVVIAMAIHCTTKDHWTQDYGIDWSKVVTWTSVTNRDGIITPETVQTQDGVTHLFNGTNWVPAL